MDIGTILVKYCLCLFNFIFVVCGIAVAAVGAWMATDQTSLLNLLKMANADTIKYFCSSVYAWKIHEETGNSGLIVEQLGWFLVALGAFIFIISFLGCCGSMKESRVLLGMYTFFLVVIFALEITCVVLFFVYRPTLEAEARDVLTSSVKRVYTTPERQNPFTATFNVIMAKSHCCGINNFTDFQEAQQWKGNKTFGQQIPTACCKLQEPVLEFKPLDANCILQPSEDNSYYKRGCFDSYVHAISSNMIIAIIAGLSVALMQIIGIVFAICIYKAAYYDYK